MIKGVVTDVSYDLSNSGTTPVITIRMQLLCDDDISNLFGSVVYLATEYEQKDNKKENCAKVEIKIDKQLPKNSMSSLKIGDQYES